MCKILEVFLAPYLKKHHKTMILIWRRKKTAPSGN